MSIKTLIIYQNKVLFNILNEIYFKEFNIVNNDNSEIDTVNQKDLKNFLIIISEKSNLEFENKLVINKFPIKIKKIKELINICFLKNNFRTQSKIKVNKFSLDINSREIKLKDKKLFLTEREINLILFLNNSSTPLNINKLQKEVWGYSSTLETHTVETHIYRLRKKIKNTFNEENFIISKKNGYQIK